MRCAFGQNVEHVIALTKFRDDLAHWNILRKLIADQARDLGAFDFSGLFRVERDALP
jgi:hypothetical protein